MLSLPRRSSHSILAACSLMAVVSLSSVAAATDLTITDGTLYFNDTVAPTYEWVIAADNNSFGIFDLTGGSVPVKILPGALNHSFCVDGNGMIGLGTDTPGANLHIATGDITATVRLQSTSITPQVWDFQGSAYGFSLMDATHGLFPFSVESGAPSDSLHVNPAGNVGFGILNPTAPIHVYKAAQSGVAETVARFEVSDDSIGKMEIGNVSAGNGIFHPRLRGTTALQAVALTMEGLITTDVGLNPVVSYNAAKRTGGAVVTRPLVVFHNNDVAKVTVAANGNVTATSFITASSRDLKDKITDLTSDEASAALRQLIPVRFVYKDDASSEPRVGFIAEDVPDLIAEPDRKSVPVMDVVALLTRVVKDQDRLLEQQQKTNDELMKRLQALENLVSAGK